MKHALAPVAALLIGVSLLFTGQGLQGTLLPVRASLEAVSTVSIVTTKVPLLRPAFSRPPS